MKKIYLIKWLRLESKSILNIDVAYSLGQPMKIWDDLGRITFIPRKEIICDFCNGLFPEYVETDGNYLYNAICEKCRNKYYSDMEVRFDKIKEEEAKNGN